MSMVQREEGSIVHLGKTKVKSPGQKKQRNLTFIILGVILVLSGVLIVFLRGGNDEYPLRDFEKAAVVLGSFNQSIQASGTVKIIRQVDLPNQTKGYADELYVSEGESITPATVLASLEVPTLTEELEDYQLSLEEARLALSKLTTENEYQIRSLNTQIERLESDLTEAGEELEKQQELVRLNASRKTDAEDAADAVKTAEQNLEDARRDLAKQNPLSALEIQSQEASIKQLVTRISRTGDEIEKARIKSPIAGEILYINSALSVPGGLIDQDTTLFTVGDRSSAVAELEVYEQYASLLKPGEELEMTVGNEKVSGTIMSIGQFAETSSDGLGASVTVTVKPDQSGGYLTPGATAVSDLSLGTRDNVLLLPRGAWLTTGSQKYVYVIRGNTAVKTKVILREIGDSNVEVLSGVEAGDEVIVSGYQNFIEYPVLSIKEENND